MTREDEMSDRVPVAGGDLEYDMRGTGEPVLFIHGAILADAFAPLLTQPALADDYRLIAYHRRGFAGSCRHLGPCTIAQQTADARRAGSPWRRARPCRRALLRWHDRPPTGPRRS